MKTSDFYYDLPKELIAQDPLEDRSASRLMHLDKTTGEYKHGHFRDILQYLKPGDCLVINDTKVIPARLYGSKVGTDAAIEILLLKRKENDIWETLVKPGKKCKVGTVISFGDGILTGEVVDIVDEGNRLIQFHYDGIFEEILDQLGEMPLPPYITHKLKDKNRYQTVYAKNDGSAAAPTAGLHFTKELLEQVKAKGVKIAHVTLHVGLGTFRPVKVDDVEQHHMHSEFYMVEEDQAKLINDTKKAGGRVISVGTTSCRTLESATGEDGILLAGSGWTEIFIYPGYRFKMIDGLITNFHLPESTLMMLVSALAGKENLEATPVAVVTENPRLKMNWNGKTICDISREFLNSNGAEKHTDIYVPAPTVSYSTGRHNTKEEWEKLVTDLNVCSQKGLVEMFDGSIGAGSVYMPYGGRYQLTETQSMVAKLPVLKGKCDTVTMMAYGFDPYLSSWSPYHGSIYAVLESISRIVAAGGDYSKIRMTYQEYFRRMNEDPKRWSQPFAALLGAYDAQIGFGLPSIGGKDSMSGTFNDIDVPPTLVSFAVDVAKEKDIITPELKKEGNQLVLFTIDKDEFDLPKYDQVMTLYTAIRNLIQDGAIVSAYALDGKGLAAAVSKMAFGNKLGVTIEDEVTSDILFAPGFGNIVAEVPVDALSKVREVIDAAGISDAASVVGYVNDKQTIECDDMVLPVEEAVKVWTAKLEGVFHTKATDDTSKVNSGLYDAKNIYVCKNKVAKPTVFIPVFPGTNCEYDSAKAFERAGADTIVKVFKNLTAEDIRDSVDEFVKAIDKSQIIMFPGGFSAGDEPEGSAKFFATAFRNAKMTEAVEKLINERDGLALGICNGFQALIKLGLVPYGEIRQQDAQSPTLTYNTINRHISKMVYTKVVSNKSPWLAQAKLGQTYCNPASHGEGRFVAPKEWLDKLFENGQVATQYVDLDGNVSMDEEWNVNGSYMSIEGITSPDGRILGKMAHSERRGESVAINIYGEQDMKIFESGVKYFK